MLANIEIKYHNNYKFNECKKLINNFRDKMV